MVKDMQAQEALLQQIFPQTAKHKQCISITYGGKNENINEAQIIAFDNFCHVIRPHCDKIVANVEPGEKGMKEHMQCMIEADISCNPLVRDWITECLKTIVAEANVANTRIHIQVRLYANVVMPEACGNALTNTDAGSWI